MDLVLKIREVRRRAGLSQTEAAKRSGVGAKSISSFESGARIESLKISQLERLLRVYAVSLAEFFSPCLDHAIAPWEVTPEEALVDEIASRLRSLPERQRTAIAEKMLAMLDGIAAILPPPSRAADRPSASIH